MVIRFKLLALLLFVGCSLRLANRNCEGEDVQSFNSELAGKNDRIFHLAWLSCSAPSETVVLNKKYLAVLRARQSVLN